MQHTKGVPLIENIGTLIADILTHFSLFICHFAAEEVLNMVGLFEFSRAKQKWGPEEENRGLRDSSPIRKCYTCTAAHWCHRIV